MLSALLKLSQQAGAASNEAFPSATRIWPLGPAAHAVSKQIEAIAQPSQTRIIGASNQQQSDRRWRPAPQ
jgi:hypothetical protein